MFGAKALVYSLPTLTRFAGAVQSMLPLKTLPFVERGRNFCERFDTVTILFSDIVSFTNLAATMDPLRVVNMLNELYRMYDGLVDKYHVYKVRLRGRQRGLLRGSVGVRLDNVGDAARTRTPHLAFVRAQYRT